jgi:hypothetical protein
MGSAPMGQLPAGCQPGWAFNPMTSEPCTPGATPPPASGDLEGGAGSIDTFDEIAGLASEEVGEGEEDVVVAGLEIENSDESDIQLTAVRLDFSTQPGNDDLDEFITEVAIMLDGKVFARVDADEFNDDNAWTKTVSLDAGAVIRMGETADLEVAVTGVNNIDTNDAGDDWGLDFISVRYEDAQDAVITDNTNTNEFLWDVVTFANAADIRFKITSGDDEINDARVINVDADDDTPNVDLFSFEVEVEGSDVELKGLQITATMAGTADILSEMFSSFSLEMDGEEVASENAPAHATDLVFDDVDEVLEAGDTYTFTLVGDYLDLSATLVAGDNVSWAFGETETDDADFDAEDEEGDDLADGDVTGSASSEAHAVYDSGIAVKLVSVEKSRTFVADSTGEQDQGEYELVFDVTAFDDDMYIDASTENDDGGNVAGQGVVYDINASPATSVATVSSATLTAAGTETLDQAGGEFWVEEGDTRRFTLNVVLAAEDGEDGSHEVVIESINWADATTAEAAGGVIDGDFTNYYTFNLDDFKTGFLFLNDIP